MAVLILPPKDPPLTYRPQRLQPHDPQQLVADSLIFLRMAFGSLDFLQGQILGKAWMTLGAVAVLAFLRRRKLTAAGALPPV
ncbi:hypothetical protein [Streptomyces oceani]|uniref:hypothetical protein n=1 Tax=Streptomyces oceani TaxID=1075402 RepID=UPI001BB00F7D|nr:hypothetical protein [Streptomyces oceani]